jgi:hypothetical protein
MKRKYGIMRRRPYRTYPRALPRPARNRYIPPLKCQNVFIKRMVEYPPFTVSTTPFTWNNSNYAFKLVDVPSFGELTGLFDQYRILKVKITWIPQLQNVVNNSNSNNWVGAPFLYHTSSDDGTVNLSTKLEAFQDSSIVRVKNPYENFSLTLTPKVQFEVQTALAIAGAAPKGNTWLDTDNPNVNHYGAAIGGYIQQVGTIVLFNPHVYSVQCEFHMEFKNPK